MIYIVQKITIDPADGSCSKENIGAYSTLELAFEETRGYELEANIRIIEVELDKIQYF